MKAEDLTSSGSFVVNDTIYQILNTDLPFGGVGFSGQGRTHGYEGFKGFSNMKSILKKPELDCFPFNKFYPPFDEATKESILKSLSNRVITQQMLCDKLTRFVVFVTLVVLAIVFRAELGELFNSLFLTIKEVKEP